MIRKSIVRRSIALALGLVVTGLTLVATAGPAAAADTDDPFVAQCTSGAYAVANTDDPKGSTPIGNSKLHLLYSPRCNTNWAEADGTPSTEIEIYVWNAQGQHEQETYFGSASFGWTDMVSGASDAGVCISDTAQGFCYSQAHAGAQPTYPFLT